MVELRPGQSASRSLHVDEKHIERYAELTGDRNPIHVSESYALRTRFKRRIAHGGITTGLISALIAEELPGPGSVFLHADWSFQNPVYIGDTITAKAEVLSVRQDKPVAVLRTSVFNQDEIMVLDGQVVIFLMAPDG